MNKTDPIISKVLDAHKVEVTPVRIFVLGLFLSNPWTKFSHDEVLRNVQQDFPTISASVVAHTLRLYKARTLLSEVFDERNTKDMKRGRPKTKFVLAGDNLLSNVEEG